VGQILQFFFIIHGKIIDAFVTPPDTPSFTKTKSQILFNISLALSKDDPKTMRCNPAV